MTVHLILCVCVCVFEWGVKHIPPGKLQMPLPAQHILLIPFLAQSEHSENGRELIEITKVGVFWNFYCGCLEAMNEETIHIYGSKIIP